MATPLEETNGTLPEEIGREPEPYLRPLERVNTEPRYAIVRDWTETCARERGAGEMSVRGIGVRVVAAVLASNDPIDEEATAKPPGGEPLARRDCKANYAPPEGFVAKAPDGASQRLNYKGDDTRIAQTKIIQSHWEVTRPLTPLKKP